MQVTDLWVGVSGSSHGTALLVAPTCGNYPKRSPDLARQGNRGQRGATSVNGWFVPDLYRNAFAIARRAAVEVPATAWFAIAAALLTLTHTWAGVLGAHLVHIAYVDWSRPNVAFYGGICWMGVSLVSWGVGLLRVGEALGVVRRITPEVTR